MDKRDLWRARKASQRILPVLESCEQCESTENLERHHIRYDDAMMFLVLCRKCHSDAHVAERKANRMKPCLICGTRFLPSHSKKHKTCSNLCLSELGRRNARKRWGRASTDLDA